ncbi:MAG: SDR family NAD(P)-dependent oxidoreductase [Myxococcales bacterium]|nr:SDR family NAD(P)-dependent oxidoreductase [Myxococcales bacterium]
MRKRYGPWAVIAGASEGIGAAFCHLCAEEGLNVVMVARRVEPLEAAAARVRRKHGVQVLTVAADLGRPDVHERLASVLAEREVGLFVYNACASTIGSFAETSTASKLASLDVNCRGPLLLLPLVIEGMRERGRGGIVLMSSLSGMQGTAMVTTYAATKAFTQILGEGLWEELGPLGIDVVVCAAGAVRTPNFEAATPADRQAQALPLAPEVVARTALQRLGRRPLTVPGWINATVAAVLQRLLPRAAAVRFMSRNTRRIYESS